MPKHHRLHIDMPCWQRSRQGNWSAPRSRIYNIPRWPPFWVVVPEKHQYSKRTHRIGQVLTMQNY